MAPLQQLAGILGLSVASGVNLYLALLVVGLAERFHWVSGLPPDLHILSHPLVLTASALLFLVEFFADKVPFVTIVWDAIHTLIRPVGGALLALAAATHLPPALQAVAMLAGGTIALGTHGTKMGVRLLAHSTPEPGSHSVLSLAEDLGVVGLLTLAYAHPYIAIPILGVILLGVALMLPLIVRVVDFLLAGLAGKAMSLVYGARHQNLPRWADHALLELAPAGRQWVGRAFARKAKGVPRLKDGFLAQTGHRWVFIHRGWFKPKTAPMDEGQLQPLRIDHLWLWDSVIFLRDGKVQEFLLPKNGLKAFSSTMGPADAGSHP
jgi:hypothetical protein